MLGSSEWVTVRLSHANARQFFSVLLRNMQQVPRLKSLAVETVARYHREHGLNPEDLTANGYPEPIVRQVCRAVRRLQETTKSEVLIIDANDNTKQLTVKFGDTEGRTMQRRELHTKVNNAVRHILGRADSVYLTLPNGGLPPRTIRDGDVLYFHSHLHFRNSLT